MPKRSKYYASYEDRKSGEMLSYTILTKKSLNRIRFRNVRIELATSIVIKLVISTLVL